MANQSYDPCDPKQALKRQAQMLGILALAIVVAIIITAVVAAIITGIWLLFRAFPIIPEVIIPATLLGSIIALPTGFFAYLIFHPIIHLATCRLSGKHKAG